MVFCYIILNTARIMPDWSHHPMQHIADAPNMALLKEWTSSSLRSYKHGTPNGVANTFHCGDATILQEALKLEL